MNEQPSEQQFNFPRRLLLGAGAWSIYFVVVYLLIEAACRIGLLRNVVEPLTLVLMVPTLAAIAYAAWPGPFGPSATAVRPDDENLPEVDPQFNQEFAHQVGWWLGIIFLLLTLAVGVTPLVLMPC